MFFLAKWACVSIIKPGCGEVVIGTDSTHSMSHSDIVAAFNKQPTCFDVCWFCAISEPIFVGIGRSSSTFFNHMSKCVCLKIGYPQNPVVYPCFALNGYNLRYPIYIYVYRHTQIKIEEVPEKYPTAIKRCNGKFLHR